METAAPERIDSSSARAGVAEAQAGLLLELVEGLADALDGVVVEGPVRQGRRGAEQLRAQDEPLGHVVTVRRHLLEPQALEAQGPLVVGAGLGLVDGRHQPFGIVVHHAGEGLAAETSVEQRDAAQGGGRVAVERLHAQGRHQHVAQDHLGDRVDRQRARLALTGVADEHGVQHLVVAEDGVGGELGHAVDQELEHVLVLAEREVVAAEARVEHVEVGVQDAGVDALHGQGPLEAPDGGRHAAQGIPGHVGFDAFVDQVVEQAVHQVLHAKRQAQGVELGLVVVAVDRGDAGGDVPFLVDVLGRDRRRRIEDDRFQLLEDGERRVEQAIAGHRRGPAPPGGQRTLEPAAHLGFELQVPADRPAHVVGRQRVLVGEQAGRS